jgi:hypothetical protein
MCRYVENVDKHCKNKLCGLCKVRRKSLKVCGGQNRTAAFGTEVSHENSDRSAKTCVWHLSS